MRTLVGLILVAMSGTAFAGAQSDSWQCFTSGTSQICQGNLRKAHAQGNTPGFAVVTDLGVGYTSFSDLSFGSQFSCVANSNLEPAMRVAASGFAGFVSITMKAGECYIVELANGSKYQAFPDRLAYVTDSCGPSGGGQTACVGTFRGFVQNPQTDAFVEFYYKGTYSWKYGTFSEVRQFRSRLNFTDFNCTPSSSITNLAAVWFDALLHRGMFTVHWDTASQVCNSIELYQEAGGQCSGAGC